MGHVRLVIGSVGDLEAILRALLGGRRRWSKARLEVLIERLKWVEVSVVGWAAFGEALSELRERTAAARLRWTLAEIARRAERSREHLSRLYNHAVVRLTVETAILWGLALEMPVWISVPESLAVSLPASAEGAKGASGAAQEAEAVAGQVSTARDAAAEARARASTRKEAGRSSDPAAGQASAGGRCAREKSGAKMKAEAVYEKVGTMWVETAAGEARVSPRVDVDGSTEVVAGQATAGEGATGVEEVAAAGHVPAGEGATEVEEVSAAGHVTAGEGATEVEEASAAGHVTASEDATGVEEVAAAWHVTVEGQPTVRAERWFDEGGAEPGTDCDSEPLRSDGDAPGEITDRPRRHITAAARRQITARGAARGHLTADLTDAPKKKIDASSLQSDSGMIHVAVAMDRRVVWLDGERRVVGEAIVSADVAASIVQARPEGAEVFVSEAPRDRSQPRRPAPGRPGESSAKGAERLTVVEPDADDLGAAELEDDMIDEGGELEDDAEDERVPLRSAGRRASQVSPQARPSRGARRARRSAEAPSSVGVDPTVERLAGVCDRLVSTMEAQQAQTKVALDLAALNGQAAATAMIESVGQVRKLEAALVRKEEALAAMVHEHQRLASEATLSPGVAAALSLAERALQAYLATISGGTRHGG